MTIRFVTLPIRVFVKITHDTCTILYNFAICNTCKTINSHKNTKTFKSTTGWSIAVVYTVCNELGPRRYVQVIEARPI